MEIRGITFTNHSLCEDQLDEWLTTRNLSLVEREVCRSAPAFWIADGSLTKGIKTAEVVTRRELLLPIDEIICRRHEYVEVVMMDRQIRMGDVDWSDPGLCLQIAHDCARKAQLEKAAKIDSATEHLKRLDEATRKILNQ